LCWVWNNWSTSWLSSQYNAFLWIIVLLIRKDVMNFVKKRDSLKVVAVYCPNNVHVVAKMIRENYRWYLYTFNVFVQVYLPIKSLKKLLNNILWWFSIINENLYFIIVIMNFIIIVLDGHVSYPSVWSAFSILLIYVEDYFKFFIHIFFNE
jgi:hypothetical protein